MIIVVVAVYYVDGRDLVDSLCCCWLWRLVVVVVVVGGVKSVVA